MGRTRSISDLVTEMKEENERLKGLMTLFNQACRKEFGYDVKTIHIMLSRQEQYERKLAEKRAAQQGSNGQ